MNKYLPLSIIIAVAMISGAMLYAGRDTGVSEMVTSTMLSDGRQLVEITARGGYFPRRVQAQAGIETIIRVTTQETYDCSVSLVIPKLNYEKFLSSNGTEDIIVPAEKATGTLSGLCSMGMYSFKIVFD